MKYNKDDVPELEMTEVPKVLRDVLEAIYTNIVHNLESVWRVYRKLCPELQDIIKNPLETCRKRNIQGQVCYGSARPRLRVMLSGNILLDYIFLYFLLFQPVQPQPTLKLPSPRTSVKSSTSLTLPSRWLGTWSLTRRSKALILEKKVGRWSRRLRSRV